MALNSLPRKVLLAGLIAVALVLALQPLFVGALLLTRQQADLAAIRAHIAQGFDRDVLAVNEKPARLLHRGGHQFTECAALLVTVDDQPDALTAALYPVMQGPYVGPCGELEKVVRGTPMAERTDYARYWHGYRVYLWPMLSAFSLETLRGINVLMLWLSAFAFIVAMRRALGPTAGAVFLIVLFSLTDVWRMGVNTPHSLSTVVILAGTALFARVYTQRPDPVAAIVMAAVFGALFNFVDFLVNPPWMPMMLAFIVVVRALKQPAPLARGTIIVALLAGGFTAAAWFGGYGLTWASEWLLAMMMSPDANQTSLSIIGQIALRLHGESHLGVRLIPLLPTLTMIFQAFIAVGSITVAILAAALALFVRAHWPAFNGRRFLLLSSPTLIAMAWFEALSNHTQTHLHFTYRSESAAIAIVYASVVLATDAPVTLSSLLSNLWRTITRRKA